MLPSHLHTTRTTSTATARSSDDDDDDDEDRPSPANNNSSSSSSSSSSNHHCHRPSSSRMFAAHPQRPQQQFPLGLTGVLCQSNTIDLPNHNRGTLHYTIYRPRNLVFYQRQQQQQQGFLSSPPPLVCVAGGPGLPCHYLNPLVHVITDRAIIVYDHAGCGQSLMANHHHHHQQQDKNNLLFDIPLMVQDLECLIQHVLLSRREDSSSNNNSNKQNCSFHLFGHSFGGILVYEYCKKQLLQQQQQQTPRLRPKCLSMTLASTPVSIAAMEEHCQHLQRDIQNELQNEQGRNKLEPKQQQPEQTNPRQQLQQQQQHRRRQRHPGDTNNDDNDNDDPSLVIQTIFSQRHECRVSPIPLPLQQSYTTAGFQSTSTGFQAVRSYQASAAAVGLHPLPPSTSTSTAAAAAADQTKDTQKYCFPPSLILRGQYDFVHEEACRGWEELLLSDNGDDVTCEFVTLAGCSHYGMLENENLYGSVLSSFFHQHEHPPKP